MHEYIFSTVQVSAAIAIAGLRYVVFTVGYKKIKTLDCKSQLKFFKITTFTSHFPSLASVCSNTCTSFEVEQHFL